ncbi:hypothetical protein ACFVDQ_18450 [Streptomyces sp. NPDC057684]|uniref:hypothetical protein n=1 Tax=Streptomyces sp. NPDC057684 TaxID=3346211 RepID=UPI003679195B
MLSELTEGVDSLHALDGLSHQAADWVARATHPDTIKSARSGTRLDQLHLAHADAFGDGPLKAIPKPVTRTNSREPHSP